MAVGEEMIHRLLLSAVTAGVGTCSVSYNIQLLHVVTGSMAFCTLEGGRLGCHFPSRVYKTNGPKTQRATIVLLSSSNIFTTDYSLFKADQQETILSNPRLFCTQCWKSTNAGNDQGDVHRCTSLFMLPGPSSHVTCVFVARHMICSRPIKLHNLYRGITMINGA